jgi:hypothetical protein
LRYLFILLFPIFLFSETAEKELFISYPEYAKMLYFEPKGPSCVYCHGEKGRVNKKIRYISKKSKYSRTFKYIDIKPIYQMKYKDFAKKMDSSLNFMPSYFLTESEIKAIYSYLVRTAQAEKKKTRNFE